MNNPNTPAPEVMLELYKIHTEMADRISQRRGSANNFFLVTNTTLISLVISAFAYSRLIKDMNHDFVLCVIFSVSIVGLANCWTWSSLIKSYKSLNSAKFKVIKNMEKIIGYKAYTAEQKRLKKTKHHKFTDIEFQVPYALSLIYTGIFILSGAFLLCSLSPLPY